MKKTVLASTLPLFTLLSYSQQAAQPNIILILSDDMGYSDIGCYGGIIKTPNLDKLAQNGLQYMQFYNTARSCPSRASLMTGLHPHQTGIGHMITDRGTDGYRGDLNNRCVTMGEVMQQAGYETYAVGKWHMARFMKENSPQHNWPLQRGFDHFYGTIAGGGSFYDPYTLCRGNNYVTPDNDPEYQPKEFYYTNAITDNAIRFLEQRNTPGVQSPFFMYVAYTAAHWPMQAPEEDVAPYKGKFDQGWDQLRKQKYEEMKKNGLIHKEWKLAVDSSVTKWKDVENKEFEARCMEVYAGMVSNMDKNIGRLIEHLRISGKLENTLIVFLQDNGGCAENIGRNRPTPFTVAIPEGKELKPMDKDELQTLLVPYRTRDGRPMRRGIGTMPGGADTYVAYGKGWAHYSNTPYREYKHWVHEGGIATPLIIHWPAGIKEKGQKRWQPGQLPDVMATFVEAAHAEYPSIYNNNAIAPCEGTSLVPSFRQDMFAYERPLFWEHEGNRAVRVGDWKLVYKAEEKKEDISLDLWELYDLKNDRTETHDLAGKYPEKVAELSSLWDEFAQRCQVRPWPVNTGK